MGAGFVLLNAFLVWFVMCIFTFFVIGIDRSGRATFPAEAAERALWTCPWTTSNFQWTTAARREWQCGWQRCRSPMVWVNDVKSYYTCTCRWHTSGSQLSFNSTDGVVWADTERMSEPDDTCVRLSGYSFVLFLYNFGFGSCIWLVTFSISSRLMMTFFGFRFFVLDFWWMKLAQNYNTIKSSKCNE